MRRWILSAAKRRRLFWVAVPILVSMLALTAVLPFAARQLVARFTVGSLAREDHELYAANASKREQALELIGEVLARRQRLRRMAFALGLPGQQWQKALTPPPRGEAGDDSLATWLGDSSGAMIAEVELITSLEPAPPCPLAALPTGSPLKAHRAVPVALFGWRISPFTGRREAHHGVTLAAAIGEPVVAPGAGRVVFAGKVRESRSNEWTRFGNVVVLDHGGGVLTVFGSLAAVDVRRGQHAVRGQEIGTVGQSGWTRVSALYYEIRWPYPGGSRPVDPALFDLALPLPDLDARLAAPDGELPDDWARVEHLPGRGR